MQLHPQRPEETPSQWQTRVLQQLTSMCGIKTFTDAATKLIAAYGDARIAENMRVVGDDHFATGCYLQARSPEPTRTRTRTLA